MVAGFRRSLSLPSPNPNPNTVRSKLPEKYSYHVRSTSLPCQSHPVISQLEDDIRALRTWQSQPEPESCSSAWLCAGLSRLEILHASVDDFLHLPQAQDSLRRSSSTENLLEVFLRFADAHGTFRSAIMALRENQSGAKVAIRRRDEPRLASSVRSQRRTEKELIRLALAIRDVSRSTVSHDAEEAEVAGIMREVVTVTVSVSVAVFSGIAAASSATLVAPPSSLRSSWMVGPLRRLSSYKKNSENGGEAWRSSAALLERLEELEECIVELESKSERVFRNLVSTRVSLLNILTPSL